MSEFRNLEAAEALLRKASEYVPWRIAMRIDAYLQRPAAPAAPAQTGLREALDLLIEAAVRVSLHEDDPLGFQDFMDAWLPRTELFLKRAALADEQAKGEANDA